MTDDAHARANAEQVRLLREALAAVDAADPCEPPAPAAAAQVAPPTGMADPVPLP